MRRVDHDPVRGVMEPTANHHGNGNISVRPESGLAAGANRLGNNENGSGILVFDSRDPRAANGPSGTILDRGISAIRTDSKARDLLDLSIADPEVAPLGLIIPRTDIRSSVGPFLTLPEYRTRYPDVVVEAIGDLYAEYNRAFGPLVEANREWPTDYQYALTPNGTPINGWVQVDMVGLPDRFLAEATNLGRDEVREGLRTRTFEFENSLAMYQLLERIHSRDGETTLFDREFRASLDDLRLKHGKPVALLATTDQKYQAMRESEFGKMGDEPVSDDEVRELSGFDKFFGPAEFLDHLSQTGGESQYLLYVRSSDPVAKLRKPDLVVPNPLLEDDDIRRVIKANAITFNADDTRWSPNDSRRINDTKGYMTEMGMAFDVHAEEDLSTAQFRQYLLANGATPEDFDAGTARIVAKPMRAAYGGYGHHRAAFGNKKFRTDLRQGLRKRGPYVVQPEMQTPVIVNTTDGRRYTYIDRNFFATDGERMRFMGGFRSLMPLDTQEAERGRVHGNGSTVWAEIY